MPSGLRRVQICVGEKDAYVRQRDVFSDYDVIFDWHGVRRDKETVNTKVAVDRIGLEGIRMVVRFSSVHGGIYAFGKAHMRSTPSLRSFTNVAFETVPMSV